MKKRYKFRLHKNSIKDEKENNSSTNLSQTLNSTSKSPQNSSSPVPQANVSSPVSSMSSASSSSPSSPSLTPSQSTPSPPGETNTNTSNTPNHEAPLKTNGFSSPVNTPIVISSSSSSSQSTTNQNTSSFNVITHLIKPIDRTFLETVHEEELPSSNNSDELNKKSVINSVSVQSFELASSSKEEKSNEQTNQSKSQLYEQLSQLKPLKSQSFKSTTSICLNPNMNGDHSSPVSSTETSNQNKVLTSSMIITPNKSNGLSKTLEASNEKPINESSSTLSKIPIASTTDCNSIFRNVQSAKFNDYSKSFPLRNGVLSKFSDRKDLNEKPLLTSSMELNCKQIDSNEFTQNGSLNDLVKSNNTIKTSMQSSMIIPRRNSTLIPPISSSLSNNTRRVSVSDL
jgi:trimeric autotransporter adhesin